MAGRMEIISLHDISLAKFLGSGGYGEVSCPVVPSCVGFNAKFGVHSVLMWHSGGVSKNFVFVIDVLNASCTSEGS